MVCEQEVRFKNKYIFNEISMNKTIYSNESYIINDLNKYKLLDFLLNDDTIIPFKRRVNIDIENYFMEELSEDFSIINLAYNNVKKFHMTPSETEISLRNLRNSLNIN